jgi:hypothetical protein
MSLDEVGRVKVWNTFFKLAREQAVSAKKSHDIHWTDPGHDFLGGTLDDEQIHSLGIVTWCLMALEAREAHLIEELKGKKRLTPRKAKAAHFRDIREQWALLAKLAGKDVRFEEPPHQAIRDLDRLRNHLFHVNFGRLLEILPSPEDAVSLFNDFVRAMEDMNVILGRHEEADREVLSIALDNKPSACPQG